MEMAMEEGWVERFEAALTRLETLEVSASAGLEEKLREAEATIAALRASGGGRKAVVGSLEAKHGVEGLSGGALDAALESLSIEQRIAVKASLLRSGAV